MKRTVRSGLAVIMAAMLCLSLMTVTALAADEMYSLKHMPAMGAVSSLGLENPSKFDVAKAGFVLPADATQISGEHYDAFDYIKEGAGAGKPMKYYYALDSFKMRGEGSPYIEYILKLSSSGFKFFGTSNPDMLGLYSGRDGVDVSVRTDGDELVISIVRI